MLSHEYEKNWSVNGDYPALVMPAGTDSLCFELQYMHAASITKLIVQQALGTAVGFSINLYNRQVCEVFAGSRSSSQPQSPITDALAKVIPTQEQHIPGMPMELFHPDGYTFRNMEGSLSDPTRKIYLEIIVDDSSEETVWEVALGCRPKF
jgi:hypothetical protein